MAEVVGFRDKRLLLMPFEGIEGLGVGCIVENTGHPLTVPVGDELLGHMVDGIGRPTDAEGLTFDKEYPVEALPPDPMTREIINTVLPLGVKAVDGLITVGKGQRIGIFAGSGAAVGAGGGTGAPGAGAAVLTRSTFHARILLNQRSCHWRASTSKDTVSSSPI